MKRFWWGERASREIKAAAVVDALPLPKRFEPWMKISARGLLEGHAMHVQPGVMMIHMNGPNEGKSEYGLVNALCEQFTPMNGHVEIHVLRVDSGVGAVARPNTYIVECDTCRAALDTLIMTGGIPLSGIVMRERCNVVDEAEDDSPDDPAALWGEG